MLVFINYWIEKYTVKHWDMYVFTLYTSSKLLAHWILIMKANEMHISQIYLIKYSTCFGQDHCPSSGVSQHCVHAIGVVILVLLASASVVSSILNTLAEANRTGMTNTCFVYTVLRYSCWWTVDLSETCRVLYQINMRTVRLFGFHYKNTSRCAVLWVSY